MSNPKHYRANLRDIFFNLFEFLEIQRHSLGQPAFGPIDESAAREALGALAAQCTDVLSLGFYESDRSPPRLDEHGDVILPEALRKTMAAYYEGEWHKLEVPTRLGGVGAPPTVTWAAFELVTGANSAAAFYMLTAVLSKVIDRLGTDAQKKRFVRAMNDRCWGGAMVLTESDAGSDVGSARTKAIHVAGDEWRIEGTKRFITNGDYASTENIIHLVLARPEGGPPGSKGLSMFIVPKYWVNEDGTLGERNGMRCTRLEKKMGIRASVTCEMSYGGDRPCRALLVGNVHSGISQMFQVIEQARMAVGIKSMSTLSSAYLNALEYTKERVQGPDMALINDKNSPRVPIVRHPDVRRMLLTQKAMAEGMRALCLFTASVQDRVEILGGHGSPEAREADRLNDLLLPMVKGYCSDKVYETLALSLQCFGGSGYTQDYPIEQYIRDQKIDALYEGTTHIQALDFFFRKVARDGGGALMALMARIEQSLQERVGGETLAHERELLARSVADVQAIFGAMTAKGADSLYHVGLHANRVLFAATEVVIAWLLVRQAAVANSARSGCSDADSAFYEGKIASAKQYCREILPNTAVARQVVESGDLFAMGVSEAAFG